MQRRICNFCKQYETTENQYKVCTGCNIAVYCSIKCKENDYERGHKNMCQSTYTKGLAQLRLYFLTHQDEISMKVPQYAKNNNTQHIILKIDCIKDTMSIHTGDESLRSVFVSTGNGEKYDEHLGKQGSIFLYFYEINTEATDSMLMVGF